jgi:hypothetical protein
MDMKTRGISAAVGAGAVVVAAGTGLVTNAGAAPAEPTHRAVFRLDAATAHRSYFGRSEAHPRPGDRLTEYAMLERNGKAVGRFMNTCFVVVGGARTNDDICNGVIEDGTSQIVLGGSGNPSVVPVLGGTGRFAYISGYVQEKPTRSGATFIVVYR